MVFLFSVGSNRGGGKVGQRVSSPGMGTIFLRKIRAIELRHIYICVERKHLRVAICKLEVVGNPWRD